MKGKSLLFLNKQRKQQIINILKNTEGNALEIGCYEGVSLITFAELFPNKIIYGVDPFISDGHLGVDKGSGNSMPDVKEVLYDNIKNKNNISFFEGTSEDFLNTKNVEEMNISTIIIDGAHILKYIKIDIELAIKCISKLDKGTIIFDDFHIDDVKKAIKYFKTRKDINILKQEHGHNMKIYEVEIKK